jgi:predicted amidophosphoribosyltransferase
MSSVCDFYLNEPLFSAGESVIHIPNLISLCYNVGENFLRPAKEGAMFCKNCGKEVSDTAEICLGCGAKPVAGYKYCNICGAETNPMAEICIKCGARVGKAEDKDVSPKSRLVVTLLAWFVGGLGIHRFYLGKIGTGILMIVTLGGLGIWSLIDFIVAVTGNMRDKDGKLIKNW